MIRVLNHAPKGKANISQDLGMVLSAIRDIKIGEELLQDYGEFDPERAQQLNTLKNKKQP